MYKFEFSNKKIISSADLAYPVDLTAVKAKSFYFAENPDDESFDSYISDTLIPSVVRNWENSTNYALLDRTIKVFVPDIQQINSEKLEIKFPILNIRNFVNIKYYPKVWNESDAKITLESEKYFISEELLRDPSFFRIKKDSVPLEFFQQENNLEAELNIGFEDNDFTDLEQEVKDTLAMQVAVTIDVKNGYCEDYYSTIIRQIYAKYSLRKELISFI